MHFPPHTPLLLSFCCILNNCFCVYVTVCPLLLKSVSDFDALSFPLPLYIPHFQTVNLPYFYSSKSKSSDTSYHSTDTFLLLLSAVNAAERQTIGQLPKTALAMEIEEVMKPALWISHSEATFWKHKMIEFKMVLIKTIRWSSFLFFSHLNHEGINTPLYWSGISEARFIVRWHRTSFSIFLSFCSRSRWEFNINQCADWCFERICHHSIYQAVGHRNIWDGHVSSL